MAQQTGEDNAKRARRHTERVINALRPPTRVGKLVVWAAPYVVGPAVEYGVRFAEERGPELAAKGAALAKEKVPAVVAAIKEKAPEVTQAAKSEVVAVVHTVREKAPLVAHTAKEKAPVVARAAMDTVVLFAQRVQERRRTSGAEERDGVAGRERTDGWEGDEERTGWEEGGR